MFIRRSIKFLLHKRKPGQTIALAIRMRVTLKGERPLDFPLGCKIDLDKWDADVERAIEIGAPEQQQHAREINRVIEEYKAQINEVFARFELLEKRLPTPQEVKDLFNDMIGRKSIMDESASPNFFLVFDLFVKQLGERNQWTKGTFQKFANTKRHIREFAPNVTFDSFDHELAQGLIRYLQEQNYRNTTISKLIAFVRWFLRWAASEGYYNGSVHTDFKPKLKGTSVEHKEIIYLSQAELKQLAECEIPQHLQSLQRVRDVFLFQCYTGLRYSDVAKLTHADIKNDTIHIVTQKTVDGLHIELNKHSRAIIERYKHKKFAGNRVLPVISNVKMNAYLKTLGELAGLNEPTRIVYFVGNVRHEEVYPKWNLLTTHAGRRTFVITALQLGIPAEVIMRWTGHSNFEAMKPYVKIVDELKAKSMSRFDEFL